MPFLAADFGCVFCGLIAMMLQKCGNLSVVNARRCAFSLGACLMLGVGFAGNVRQSCEDFIKTTLAACFDASGKKHGEVRVVVAGFISSTTDWDAFDLAWRMRLSDDRIEYFHMVEFAQSRCPSGKGA